MFGDYGCERSERENEVKILRNLFAVLLVLGLGACAQPSHRELFALAADAVRADERFPENAKVTRRDNSQIYIAKNAGTVQVPYEVDGKPASYTVWLKRVALTWTVDRVDPTPTYD